MSMFPLNGWISDGWRPSAMTRSTASAPVNSTLARVVSKWVLLGMTLPGPPIAVNRIFSAARPWWVGMTCLNGNRSWTASRNTNQLRAAGVALVAALDRGPLVAAHRARAGVRQEVDEDVVGVQVEQVPAGGLERPLALGLGGQPDRLDGVDAEGLDDGLSSGPSPGGYAAGAVRHAPCSPHTTGLSDARLGPCSTSSWWVSMGSGKTTVGTLVALSALAGPLRDSDADIAAREGRTVREIRDALGTRAIHDLEAAHLCDALADPEPASSAPRPPPSTIPPSGCPARTDGRRVLAHRDARHRRRPFRGPAAPSAVWRGSRDVPRAAGGGSRPAVPLGVHGRAGDRWPGRPRSSPTSSWSWPPNRPSPDSPAPPRPAPHRPWTATRRP